MYTQSHPQHWAQEYDQEDGLCLFSEHTAMLNVTK